MNDTIACPFVIDWTLGIASKNADRLFDKTDRGKRVSLAVIESRKDS